MNGKLAIRSNMSSYKLSELFVEYNCFKCLSVGVSLESKSS